MRYSASLAEEVAGVLAATVPLGMPSGKVGHHPGWKPLQGSATAISQARLQARAGSPDPSEGTCLSPASESEWSEMRHGERESKSQRRTRHFMSAL